jgi:hypothetical protein
LPKAAQRRPAAGMGALNHFPRRDLGLNAMHSENIRKSSFIAEVKNVLRPVKNMLRAVKNYPGYRLHHRELSSRFRDFQNRAPKKPHQLGAPLVVTLTSYPPRFKLLHFNLMSLLAQTVSTDRVVLWIAEEDKSMLPEKVHSLTRLGLEIRYTSQLRSYKKLIPSLTAFPDAFLVTADDDVVYPENWLESLVAGYDRHAPTIVCRRAHRIVRNGEGFAPYLKWQMNVSDRQSSQPSSDLLPVGIGGTLYPPHSLHADVIDTPSFMRLCPQADDLWFWWMGRRTGVRIKRVDGGDNLEMVPGSQESSLMHTNWAGGNDRQLAALVAEFGIDDIEDKPRETRAAQPAKA